MDRFRQLEVFVEVAQAQGFAVAARRLNLSPPAVTRAVAQLEARLGVALLTRTTRHVRMTEAGRRYLEDARQILSAIEVADAQAGGVDAEPRGALVVTAPVLFGRKFVLPGIVDFLERYPLMQVDALLLDRVVNLVEEGVDVGVRIGELPDSSMRAIRVGSVRMLVLAAPGYLEKHGAPNAPEDLSRHCLIASRAGSFSPTWRFRSGRRERGQVIAPRLNVTSNDAALDAALSGFGITRLLSYQVAEELRDERLQILLEDYELPSQPVHIVHRESRRGSTASRALIDLLAEWLREEPGLRWSGTS